MEVQPEVRKHNKHNGGNKDAAQPEPDVIALLEESEFSASSFGHLMRRTPPIESALHD